VEFSSNLSVIYTKWCAQTSPPIFGLFAIFDRNFAKIVAPLSDGSEIYIVHLKERSLLKKRWKLRRNRAINGNAMLVRTMQPSNEQRAGLGEWQKTYKHHIFASTAGARSTIFPKLCTVIEFVVPIQKVSTIFRSNS